MIGFRRQSIKISLIILKKIKAQFLDGALHFNLDCNNKVVYQLKDHTVKEFRTKFIQKN